MTRVARHQAVPDRGSADALGLVLIAPVAIGLAVLVVALGRDVDARAQVRSAAAAGAQAAALERSGPAAERAARRLVAAMLVDQDACPAPDVVVDFPSEPRSGAGIAFGSVEVTVRCDVSNRGLDLVRPDGSVEEFRASATVDFFRSRERP